MAPLLFVVSQGAENLCMVVEVEVIHPGERGYDALLRITGHF